MVKRWDNMYSRYLEGHMVSHPRNGGGHLFWFHLTSSWFPDWARTMWWLMPWAEGKNMLHLNAKGDLAQRNRSGEENLGWIQGQQRSVCHSRKDWNGSYQWALITYQQNLGLFVQRDIEVDIAQRGTWQPLGRLWKHETSPCRYDGAQTSGIIGQTWSKTHVTLACQQHWASYLKWVGLLSPTSIQRNVE